MAAALDASDESGGVLHEPATLIRVGTRRRPAEGSCCPGSQGSGKRAAQERRDVGRGHHQLGGRGRRPGPDAGGRAFEALPGIGKVRAAAIMEQLGIAASRRVRGLGIHQRQALVDFIDEK